MINRVGNNVYKSPPDQNQNLSRIKKEELDDGEHKYYEDKETYDTEHDDRYEFNDSGHDDRYGFNLKQKKESKLFSKNIYSPIKYIKDKKIKHKAATTIKRFVIERQKYFKTRIESIKVNKQICFIYYTIYKPKKNYGNGSMEREYVHFGSYQNTEKDDALKYWVRIFDITPPWFEKIKNAPNGIIARNYGHKETIVLRRDYPTIEANFTPYKIESGLRLLEIRDHFELQLRFTPLDDNRFYSVTHSAGRVDLHSFQFINNNYIKENEIDIRLFYTLIDAMEKLHDVKWFILNISPHNIIVKFDENKTPAKLIFVGFEKSFSSVGCYTFGYYSTTYSTGYYTPKGLLEIIQPFLNQKQDLLLEHNQLVQLLKTKEQQPAKQNTQWWRHTKQNLAHLETQKLMRLKIQELEAKIETFNEKITLIFRAIDMWGMFKTILVSTGYFIDFMLGSRDEDIRALMEGNPFDKEKYYLDEVEGLLVDYYNQINLGGVQEFIDIYIKEKFHSSLMRLFESPVDYIVGLFVEEDKKGIKPQMPSLSSMFKDFEIPKRI